MLKKYLLWFACLCSFSLHAGSGPLIVGTNAEFPPFTYIENNTIVGFDIDVAKEVAKRLGREIEFKDMPFDALIPEIVLGRVDFVAAGMSYTEERAKRVLFTKSYLKEDPLVILSKNKNSELKDLNSLNKRKVVVIEGFTSDLYLSKNPEILLTRLPTQTDGFLALKSGRADAFVTAKSTVDSFFVKNDPSQYSVYPIEGTGETCALVVPKSKPELLAEIQKTLDAMEQDGTMAQLKQKWKLS